VFSYAAYHVETLPPNGAYTPCEWFESGWDNDDGFLQYLAQTGVVYFAIDPEDFEGWPGYTMEWTEVFAPTDLDLAAYTTAQLPPALGTTTIDGDTFDSAWVNDEVPQGAHRYLYIDHLDGAPPAWVDPADAVAKYIVGSNSQLRLWLGKLAGTWSIFDETITMTPGTYTPADLVVHLQAITTAALLTEGFGATDIQWFVLPSGGLGVRNALSTYHMRLRDASGWSAIGFTLPSLCWYGGAQAVASHAVPYKDADLGFALYGAGLAFESYEIDWDNGIGEYLWVGAAWIDGDASDPTSFVITLANNKIWILLDDLGGNTALLDITLASGTYTLATMVVEVAAKVAAALVAAGVPWAPGHLAVAASPSDHIRITNQAGLVAGNSWLLEPPAASAWATLGFAIDQSYSNLDRHSRRVDEDVCTWTLALYDAGANGFENFEGVWSPLS
jgi:hypothetical protein